MKSTYRLEFNEKQQCFHLDDFTHDEGTNGWFTIFKRCTDDEFNVYENYINLNKKKKFTKAYLLKCAAEIKQFIKDEFKKDALDES